MSNKTNTISTRVMLEGQAEFKRDVSTLKSELRSYASELKLLDTQYGDTSTSITALRKQFDSLKSSLEAQKNLTDTYRKRQEQVNEAIGLEKAALDLNMGALDTYTQRKESLNGALQDNERFLAASVAKLEEEKQAYAEQEDVVWGMQSAITRYNEEEQKHLAKVAELNSSIDSYNARLETQKAETGEIQRLIEKHSKSIEDYKNKQKALDDQLAKGEITEEEYKKQTEKTSAAIEKASGWLEKKKTALAENERKINDTNASLDKFNAKVKTEQGLAESAAKSSKDMGDAIESLHAPVVQAEQDVKYYANEQERLKKEVVAVDTALDDTERKIKNNNTNIKDWTHESNDLNVQINKSEEAEIKLGNALADTTKKLEQTKVATEGLSEADKLQIEQAEKERIAIQELAQEFANNEIKEAAADIAEALGKCVDASKEFESAITGVAKTTDFTKDELADFSKEVRALALEIPATTTELAQIAELGGQMGIPKEGLKDFTETIANLGVATNLTSSEAAEMLSQFASVTGLPTTEYSKMASAIVDLGNNYATTEKNIALFAQRLVGATTTVSIAEPDVLGLVTAVSSLGVRADAGATSLQSLITKLDLAVSTGEGVEDWAKTMGITTEALTNMWRDDAMGAITLLIHGLGDLGSSMTTQLINLGISEQRVTRVVKTLANAEHNTGLLTRALTTANEAWEDDSALINEAAKRYETLESKQILLDNAVNDLKISVGDSLNPVIKDMTELGTGAVTMVSNLVRDTPALVPIISGLVAGLGAAAISLAKISPLVTELKAKVGELIAAQGGLASAANLQLAGAVAAIAALTVAIAYLVENYESATKEARQFKKEVEETVKTSEENIKAVEDQSDATMALITTVERLSKKENKSAADKQVLLEAVEDLNEAMPELGIAYDFVSDKLTTLDGKEKANIETIKNVAKAQAEQALQEQKVAALKDLYIEQAEAEEKLARAELELAAARERLAEAEANGAGNAEMYRAQYADAMGAVNQYQKAYDDATSAIDTYSQGLDYASANTTEKVSVWEMELSEVQKLYGNTVKLIMEGLEKTVNGFEKVDKASTTSKETMLKNLQSQMDWLTKYDENRHDLMTRNVDGASRFVEQIVSAYGEGTQETAGYLASLAELTDDELQVMIDAWDGVRDKEQEVAEHIADDTNQMGERLKELSDNIEGSGDRIEGAFEDVSEAAQDAKNSILRLNGTRVEVRTNGAGNMYIGAYAQGLDYVPYDDYLTRLHEGEMVLTKAEARAYRLSKFSEDNSIHNSNSTNNFGGVTINVNTRTGQSNKEIAREVIGMIDLDVIKKKARMQ